MEQLPLISIVVPVYNVAEYLNCCVESMTGQTYPNLEILLVDDGSKDESGAICDAWAARDSRVKAIHQENGGAGKARNTALAAATGELLAFVDGDDYMAPGMLEHLYQIMTQNHADIAECGYVYTMDDAAVFEEAAEPAHVYTTKDAMREHILDEGAFQQVIWNKLYKRSLTDGIPFPEGKLIDDEFWTYQILGRARCLTRSEAKLYGYRQRPMSAMSRPFSLRRLHGVEAKQQRLHYIREYFPELRYEAEYDLFFACMFTMQGCLKLPKEQRQTAKDTIGAILADLPRLNANPQASRMRNILLKMGQLQFLPTCRLLNFLIDIHVLT